jgi:hypothetical protein
MTRDFLFLPDNILTCIAITKAGDQCPNEWYMFRLCEKHWAANRRLLAEGKQLAYVGMNNHAGREVVLDG